MKTTFLLFIFVAAALLVSAQEVVSSGGETQTAAGTEVSWTIGETVTETVATATTVLTQGFQQSGLTVTAASEPISSEFDIKVFPNPASEFVTIQLNKFEKDQNFGLFNATAKLLENQIISSETTKVNLKNKPAGTYFLKIQYHSGQPVQTFKIVKK